jgi:hypothetical protein
MTIKELNKTWNDLDLETFQVGPSWSGRSRAVAMIGNVQILIDTNMPNSFLEESSEVYSCWFEFPKTKAKEIAKQYQTAVAEESYYPSENYDEYFIQFTDKNEYLQYLIKYHQDELCK